MKDKEIEIIVDENGSISIEQIGWEGKNCENAIDDLIKALGTETETIKTKEYYTKAKNTVKQKGK